MVIKIIVDVMLGRRWMSPTNFRVQIDVVHVAAPLARFIMMMTLLGRTAYAVYVHHDVLLGYGKYQVHYVHPIWSHVADIRVARFLPSNGPHRQQMAYLVAYECNPKNGW